MSNRSVPVRTVVALVLCAGMASVAAVWLLGRPTVAAKSPGPRINVDAASQLRGIDAYTPLGTLDPPEQAPPLLTGIVSAARAAGLPPAEAQHVAQLAFDRFALYSNPTQEGYERQVRALLGGKSWDELATNGVVPSRELWQKMADRISGGTYAVDHVEVRNLGPGGASPWVGKGGRLHETTDLGAYSNEKTAPGDIWEVVVPVHFSNLRGIGPRKLFFAQAFRKRTSDGKWVPYRASFYDPEVKSSWLPSAWL
jgi:hypothetical protein